MGTQQQRQKLLNGIKVFATRCVVLRNTTERFYGLSITRSSSICLLLALSHQSRLVSAGTYQPIQISWYQSGMSIDTDCCCLKQWVQQSWGGKLSGRRDVLLLTECNLKWCCIKSNAKRDVKRHFFFFFFRFELTVFYQNSVTASFFFTCLQHKDNQCKKLNLVPKRYSSNFKWKAFGWKLDTAVSFSSLQI